MIATLAAIGGTLLGLVAGAAAAAIWTDRPAQAARADVAENPAPGLVPINSVQHKIRSLRPWQRRWSWYACMTNPDGHVIDEQDGWAWTARGARRARRDRIARWIRHIAALRDPVDEAAADTVELVGYPGASESYDERYWREAGAAITPDHGYTPRETT